MQNSSSYARLSIVCNELPPFLGHVELVEGEWEADGLQHQRDELHVPGQLQQGNVVRDLEKVLIVGEGKKCLQPCVEVPFSLLLNSDLT